LPLEICWSQFTACGSAVFNAVQKIEARPTLLGLPHLISACGRCCCTVEDSSHGPHRLLGRSIIRLQHRGAVRLRPAQHSPAVGGADGGGEARLGWKEVRQGGRRGGGRRERRGGAGGRRGGGGDGRGAPHQRRRGGQLLCEEWQPHARQVRLPKPRAHGRRVPAVRPSGRLARADRPRVFHDVRVRRRPRLLRRAEAPLRVYSALDVDAAVDLFQRALVDPLLQALPRREDLPAVARERPLQALRRAAEQARQEALPREARLLLDPPRD
jgi:hypothetical protein